MTLIGEQEWGARVESSSMPQHMSDSSPAPSDPDLLWVESVTERLLGSGSPRPWERAFFGEQDDPPGQADAPEGAGKESDAGAAGSRPGVPMSEADADWASEQPTGRDLAGRRVLDLTPAEAEQDLDAAALRLALRSHDNELAEVVVALLAERTRDRARLAQLRAVLEALVDRGDAQQTALLARLLAR